MKQNSNSLLPIETIQSKIFVIRGKKVLIDRHLSELYGVTTGRLNEQVKRNINRFPIDFMFQLDEAEYRNLISQFATSSWGGIRKLPFAFTENGVAMLSSVLNSPKAIEVNIQIMRVFTKLREMLSTHEELKKKFEEWEKKYDTRLNKMDGRVQTVLEAFQEIKRLLNPSTNNKKRIGFIQED
jgi:hypothetical protein